MLLPFRSCSLSGLDGSYFRAFALRRGGRGHQALWVVPWNTGELVAIERYRTLRQQDGNREDSNRIAASVAEAVVTLAVCPLAAEVPITGARSWRACSRCA